MISEIAPTGVYDVYKARPKGIDVFCCLKILKPTGQSSAFRNQAEIEEFFGKLCRFNDLRVIEPVSCMVQFTFDQYISFAHP
jgi:hypothetical protein